ncbi:MAG: hypothetical protein GX447_07740 [Elusimicrobia bacterium]|nr:hypothetical protein [Elusimicrobiota bacterium]
MSKIFYLFLCLTSFCNALPSEPAQVYKEAVNSWKEGRYEDSIEAYKYLVYISTADKDLITYTRDLAILLNDTGRAATAKIYIEKLEAAGLEDPYLKYEKGLALYGLKKFYEAKKAFNEAPLLTSDEDLIYSARFMSAMTEYELSGPMKAAQEFQSIYQKYPYLLAPSSYMIADAYEKAKKRSVSVNFLKETLVYDSKNIQAFIKMAKLYEDTGYYLSAWQSYYTLSELDPENRYFISAKKRLLKNAAREKNPDNLLYWARLAWPAHQSQVDIPQGKKMRVGLFSSLKNQYETEGFDFISNSDFEVFDSKLGKTFSGKKNFQYSLNYILKDRIFELKDNAGARVYTTRQNFSIIPSDKNQVLLIKTPKFSYETPGINKSDRELTGNLEVYVSTSGMRLINETFSGHIITGILSKMDIPKENKEFLKAAAIALRTAVEDYWTKPVSSKYDICDSQDCMEYIGLQFENPAAAEAVKKTQGQRLSGGYGDKLTFHRACGGKTFLGADDKAMRNLEYTPWGLEKYFSSAPSRETYCLPEDSTMFSEAMWTILLEPYWIEERINPKYPVGKIKNILITERDEKLRPTGIKIIGTAADISVQGRKEVNQVLSGNNFRSEIFTMRPLLKGNKAAYFIVKGIGTGDLEDFCLLGGYGLAKHHGFTYDKILKHYFPDSQITGIPQLQKNSSPKKTKK